jgi:Asp-tRNA(Asn)/Glu-tRNA(Gln) amidotransferase B subunit
MAAPLSVKTWQSAVQLLDDLAADLAQCHSKQTAMDPHKLQSQTSKLAQLVQAVTDNPVSAAAAKKLVQSQVCSHALMCA